MSSFLNEFIICVDKAQKDGKHEVKHKDIAKMNNLMFLPLPYGDYCLATNTIVETIKRRGELLKKIDLVGKIKISVDTKANMEEIYTNIIGTSHKRFRDECILARDNGCQLIVLIENENGIKELSDVHTWKNPRILRYFHFRKLKEQGKAQNVKLASKPPADSYTLQRAMETMEEKYGVKFMFCTKKECGEKIIQLLTEKE